MTPISGLMFSLHSANSMSCFILWYLIWINTVYSMYSLRASNIENLKHSQNLCVICNNPLTKAFAMCSWAL